MSNSIVLKGNCLETLKDLPDDSIDSVVTDPPYGLSFMGKKWDYSVPSVQIWSEVFRVLKPGGHLLSFGGTRTYHRLVVAIEDAGFEIRDQIQWIYGSGFPKSHNLPGGLGTALKPANEPICVARKPLSESTVAKNVLKHGTGALNIDASRIGSEGPRQGDYKQVTGRWPANVIFDEDAAAMLDEQSGTLKSGAITAGQPAGRDMRAGDVDRMRKSGRPAQPISLPGSSGGASRFFYCAKASKRERGDGNVHPTVKPVKLMEYLITLVTPPGGIVLDPFMGSGTTGVACKNLGFDFIGCEMNDEYVAIAEKRLANA